MAKLYFRHGAMGSAKTLNMLAVAYNYRQQGKEVFLMKPKLEDRFGKESIKSRAGIEMRADLLLEPDTIISFDQLEGISCILVDEAQFLSEKIIDQLRDLTRIMKIPVICYGLRTDFRTRLFAGSKRLLELADTIEEIKTTCYLCNKKAIFNLRLVDGEAVTDGPSIQLGAEELYQPTCHICYHNEIQKAKRAALKKEEAELALTQ